MGAPLPEWNSTVNDLKRPLLEGDFGESAYGPMILLRLNPQGGVAWLRAILDDLARSATGTAFRLEAQPRVSFTSDLNRLQLQVVASSPARHLQIEGPGAFLWCS